MDSNISQQQLIKFLGCDRMRNIVPLKMLATHGSAIQHYFYQDGDAAGALLFFPTSLFAYDRQVYRDRDLVVLLVVNHTSVVKTLLSRLPVGCKFVFKGMSTAVWEIVAQSFPLVRARAFRSYTTTPNCVLCAHTQVITANHVDEQLYPDYAQHGHTRAMISDYFADGQGLAFTLYQQQLPVAACFTYCNFEDIHEVGGVLTLPGERQKGYAKLVVESALHALHQRGRTPRYQVDELNLPSIRLAESLGLIPFVTVEHWLN